MITCGTCTYFELSSQYSFGLCRRPRPWWSVEDSPTIFRDDDTYDCDCYKQSMTECKCNMMEIERDNAIADGKAAFELSKELRCRAVKAERERDMLIEKMAVELGCWDDDPILGPLIKQAYSPDENERKERQEP